MKGVIYLEPHERAHLVQEYLRAHPIPIQTDFIKAITGKPISLADWQKYGLRGELVQQVLQGK